MSETRHKVKKLLARGKTVLEIGRILEISPQAVYKHKQRIEREATAPKRRAS